MAVPPKLAKVVFESVLKSLIGIEYETVELNLEPKSMSLFNTFKKQK